MFSIKLANVRANWIDVDLTVGDVTRQFSASSVLNDPLRELADLGVFIATREPGALGVRFWLEPAGVELRAEWRPDLVLVIYEAQKASPALYQPRLIGEHGLQPSEAARAIWRGLAGIQDSVSPHSWRHEFPAERMSWLADAIATS